MKHKTYNFEKEILEAIKHLENAVREANELERGRVDFDSMIKVHEARAILSAIVGTRPEQGQFVKVDKTIHNRILRGWIPAYVTFTREGKQGDALGKVLAVSEEGDSLKLSVMVDGERVQDVDDSQLVRVSINNWHEV